MNHLPNYMINSLFNRFIIILIKSYKYMISGFLPNACRFAPSCSNYAIDALQKYGFFMGCGLAFRRLSKCHPLYRGTNYDPIP